MGKLAWRDRCDIGCGVSKFAQFLGRAGQTNMNNAISVMRYVKAVPAVMEVSPFSPSCFPGRPDVQELVPKYSVFTESGADHVGDIY